jgi:HAMP domain-containing protein
MRREILQQFSPDRDRWDQLSPEERELIMAKVNERMLGIQQGIQIIQQKASKQAADARTAAVTAAESVSRAPSSPKPAPSPTRQSQVAAGTSATATVHREVALSGTKMDVRVMQEGEVLGQVKAEINLPNLLATVFRTTRRDRGEVPFAVDKSGMIYTPSDADRAVITSLKTKASPAGSPPGTRLLQDWAVATTADPTGSGLKFGIARPLSGALDELRRLSARNAAIGLGLIGLALIGIVPLSSRLTRNLSRLSDGVNRLATGDYRTRVDGLVERRDRQAGGAFNRMAATSSAINRPRSIRSAARELELGRQIQHDMLPHAPLRLGLTENPRRLGAGAEVGGDFFNYFQTPIGKIALVVGDVSGKGVGARC